jgi:hypothetical protein
MIAAAAAVIVIAAIAGYVMTRPDAPPQTLPAGAATAAPAPVSTPPQSASSGPVNPAAATPEPEAKKPEPVVDKKASAAPSKKSATPPVTPADPPPATPPRAGNVVAAFSAAYPFEVRDGSRVVSPAATTHELAGQTHGRTLRLVAADLLLDHPVKIDGGVDNRFEYSPPGMGRINLRAARTDCRAMIGKRDLGYAPWSPFQVVAGEYRIDLICPDGLNPFQQVTVVQGRTAEVRILQK